MILDGIPAHVPGADGPYAGQATTERALRAIQLRLETLAAATNTPLWAVATANWTNAAGNGSYVDCNKATDRTGTLGTGTVRVYLPRAAGKDPNVRSGETIVYLLDANGVAVATGAYLDDKIGTVKQWAGTSGSVPGGWAIMDGSANSAGSALDANGRFLEGITSGSVAVAAASGTSASNTTGISVAAHAKADVAGSISVDAHTGSAVAGVIDNHTGTLSTGGPSGTETVDKNVDGTTVAVAADNHTHDVDIGTLGHTGSGNLSHSVSASGGSDLAHSVTDTGHGHGAGTIEPPAIQLFYIERVS